MSWQQYPGPNGTYGGPGGQPPPSQYGGGYPQANYNNGPPNTQGYPQSPHQQYAPQGAFPPPQSGGSADAYFNQQASDRMSQQQPPYGQYNSQSGYPPQPDAYNNPNRQSYAGPPPNSSFPMTPDSYSNLNPGYGAPSQQMGAYPNQQQPYANGQQYPGAPGGAPGPYGQPNQNQPQQYPHQQPYGQQQYPNQQQYPQQHNQHYNGPSPGYEEPPHSNPLEYGRQADCLRRAMKGLGTDESELIRVISQLTTPFAVHSIAMAFNQRHGRALLNDVKKETSGHFQDSLLAVLRGPLLQDVHALHRAIFRPGTGEALLNDVLLSRTPADLSAIAKAYQRQYSRNLEDDVRGDLSLKTEDMFAFVLKNRRADDSVPVDFSQAENDARNIHMAAEGSTGTGLGGVFGGSHQAAIYSTLLLKNDAQVCAIAHAYERLHFRRLDVMIEKKFSGHMRMALLYVVQGGLDKATRDARLLDEAMRGIGTKDILLIHRLVKCRWNKAHFENVKRAYYHLYSRPLEDAVRADTSGDYRKFLLALIN